MLRFLKYTFQSTKLMMIILILLCQNSFANQSKFDTTDVTFIDIEADDICIVCDMPINSKKGIGFLFKGRKVTLDSKHLIDFINNPDKYFHKLQANVALYDEGRFDKYQISYVWFLVGLWILFALISAAICSNLALKKSKNFNKWFYVGLISNLFGLIYLLFLSKDQFSELPKKLGKLSQTEAPVKCNGCNQYNHPKAIECMNCGIVLYPDGESEINRI